MTSLRRTSTAAARAAAVLTAVLALSACGGGGGGGPDYQVAFGRSPLTADAVAGVASQSVTVRVTLSPAPPASASVQLHQTGSDFDLLGHDVADLGGGAFDVTLPLASTLVAGRRTGTLSFRLCPDVACAAP